MNEKTVVENYQDYGFDNLMEVMLK